MPSNPFLHQGSQKWPPAPGSRVLLPPELLLRGAGAGRESGSVGQLAMCHTRAWDGCTVVWKQPENAAQVGVLGFIGTGSLSGIGCSPAKCERCSAQQGHAGNSREVPVWLFFRPPVSSGCCCRGASSALSSPSQHCWLIKSNNNFQDSLLTP